MKKNIFKNQITEFKRDVLAGMSHHKKFLKPKYFYDSSGSALFKKISELDEYYLTRTEIKILSYYGKNIARKLGDGIILIVYGAGSWTKINILLKQIKNINRIIIIDIDEAELKKIKIEIKNSYPYITSQIIVSDFSKKITISSMFQRNETPVIFFPGSTIGNFDITEINQFLKMTHECIGGKGYFLVSVDLKKDRKIIEGAYNDRAGITAEFNKNVLNRINSELSGDFDLNYFKHVAFYDDIKGRIEMYLESLKLQTVRIGNNNFDFKKGERIQTEYSYKFSISEFQNIVRRSNFMPLKFWTDPNKFFAVHLLKTLL